ncbi:hypothetical protein KKD52_10185 [Myxococcota bacterium]|nr:hypothetical protein [Myxococcota bacterium]
MKPSGTINTEPTVARYDLAVVALLESRSLDQAIKKIGISKTTLFRWFADPVFVDLYRRARGRLVTAVIGRLQVLGAKACNALESVLDDADAAPQTKISAARAVLEMIFRGHELDNLEARVEELEQLEKAGSK